MNNLRVVFVGILVVICWSVVTIAVIGLFIVVVIGFIIISLVVIIIVNGVFVVIIGVHFGVFLPMYVVVWFGIIASVVRETFDITSLVVAGRVGTMVFISGLENYYITKSERL